MSDNKIKSPHSLRTSRFEPSDIWYERNGFIIAKGYDPKTRECLLACRWHSPTDLGYPNGFGKQQWMLLPHNPTDVGWRENELSQKVFYMNLPLTKPPFRYGSFVKYCNIWHIITNYSDNKKAVEIQWLQHDDTHALDKVLVTIDQLEDFSNPISSLVSWHWGKMHLWFYHGEYFITYCSTGLDENGGLDSPNNVFIKYRIIPYIVNYEGEDIVMIKQISGETFVSLKSLEWHTLLNTVEIDDVDNPPERMAAQERVTDGFFDVIDMESLNGFGLKPSFDKYKIEERTFWKDMQESFGTSDYVWECVEMDRIDNELGYKKLIIPS